MLNQPWNAQSASEFYKKQKDKEQQIQMQLNELRQQSSVLSDVKSYALNNIKCIRSILELTSQNTEVVKQIAQMTLENQKSSRKQFLASTAISISALIVAIISLIITII